MHLSDEITWGCQACVSMIPCIQMNLSLRMRSGAAVPPSHCVKLRSKSRAGAVFSTSIKQAFCCLMVLAKYSAKNVSTS